MSKYQDEKRKTYPSGAERSKLDDVRYDLISPFALRRLAQTYALGASLYGDNNWRKGMPVSAHLNHVLKHINTYMAGAETPEDELAHAAWGLLAIMEQEVTHPELDDRYRFERRDLSTIPDISDTEESGYKACEHGVWVPNCDLCAPKSDSRGKCPECEQWVKLGSMHTHPPAPETC